MNKDILIKTLSRIVVYSSAASLAAMAGDNESFIGYSIKFKENASELIKSLGYDANEVVNLLIAEIDAIDQDV